jgi:hypothetical protein
MPKDQRTKIEEVLRRYGRDTHIVEAGQPAHFIVDVKDNRLQLFSADGLQEVGSFAMDSPQWGTGLATVLSRSAGAAELLTLDNPAAQLKIDVRVAGVPRRATRGIAIVADTQPAQYHVRHGGEPRTTSNSLQLEIQTTADSYLTIVDVDSEGRLNLLFPNDHQQPSFYPEGRLRAGELATIPDSLQPGNHAGFHWDYAPPQGTDTLRVFASTDLETAQAIRQRVRAVPPSPTAGMGAVTTRSAVSTGVTNLRQELTTVATRGLTSIYDPTPAALTGQATAAPAQQPTPPPSAPLSSQSPDKTFSAGPAQATAQSSAAASAADWTATSLTIQVEP